MSVIPSFTRKQKTNSLVTASGSVRAKLTDYISEIAKNTSSLIAHDKTLATAEAEIQAERVSVAKAVEDGTNLSAGVEALLKFKKGDTLDTSEA
jgi:hypothetical protein